MDTKRMRACAPLLPEPGDSVVCECLDEIERLQSELAAYAASDRIKTENIERLRAENARMEAREAKAHKIAQTAIADAARYRWLRNSRLWLKANLPMIAAPEFDAAIDAAMRDAGQGGDA